MCANLRPLLVPVVVGEERVRRQLRHVASDAPPYERVSALRIETAAPRSVTAETTSREGNDIALRLVDVVASRARHLRRAEARASLQQRNLVAMDIHLLVRREELQYKVRVEWLARHV